MPGWYRLERYVNLKPYGCHRPSCTLVNDYNGQIENLSRPFQRILQQNRWFSANRLDVGYRLCRTLPGSCLLTINRYSPPAGTDQLPSVSSIISRSSQKEFTSADLQSSGKSSGSILIYPVPYSEHSSFYELTCFAMSFNWMKMIATVNVGSETSRRKMFKWISRWEAERKKRGKDIIIPHRHPDYWWQMPF